MVAEKKDSAIMCAEVNAVTDSIAHRPLPSARTEICFSRHEKDGECGKHLGGNSPPQSSDTLQKTKSAVISCNYEAYTSAATDVNVQATLRYHANKLRLRRALRMRVSPKSMLKLNHADSCYHTFLINHI